MAVITATEAGGLKVLTFLDVTAFSEGTDPNPFTRDHGYDLIVNGMGDDGRVVHATFSDYSRHPFAAGRLPVLVRRVPRLLSTASGRYQINLPTWRRLQIALGLPDFSPESQDRAALELLRENKANVLLLAGDVKGAVAAVSHIWASFPGNTYGQGGKALDAELDAYVKLQATEPA